MSLPSPRRAPSLAAAPLAHLKGRSQPGYLPLASSVAGEFEWRGPDTAGQALLLLPRAGCKGQGEGPCPTRPHSAAGGLFINQESAPSWAHYQLNFLWHCRKMLISILKEEWHAFLSSFCLPYLCSFRNPHPCPYVPSPGWWQGPLCRQAQARAEEIRDFGGWDCREGRKTTRVQSFRDTQFGAPELVSPTGGGGSEDSGWSQEMDSFPGGEG